MYMYVTNNIYIYIERERERKREIPTQPAKAPRRRARAWVFIKGGCSRRGVQWMGVALYNHTDCNIM